MTTFLIPRKAAVAVSLTRPAILFAASLLPAAVISAHAQPSASPPEAATPVFARHDCGLGTLESLRRNPTAAEIRCRFGVSGPGRFGLLSYLDVPVYQPATPLPGTHVVGVPGMPRPRLGESFEAWEWRVLRTRYGPEVHRVQRGLEVLDPVFLSMILRFERELAQRGVRARRRETWRAPERQAWVFQQGRSRPGPFATTTLTSWHCRVDRLGRPAARAADYDVPGSHLAAFHGIAELVGMRSYGADSHDPGHVYLPDEDAASGLEVAVLRLLDRVPHVTLATGRPDGEPVPPGYRELWRRRSFQFAADPLRPWPDETPALAPTPAVAAARPASPPASDSPPPARRSRRN
jgi:hypothetical protein